MRRAAWLCASLLTVGSVKAVRAQSSHLSDLERAAPATTGDPVATAAAGAWRAVWTVPAAAPSLRGVLVGLEQNDFGSVATVLVAARFNLGLLWQLQFAESHVGDVVDQDLIVQYPELAGLRVMARFLAVDGVHTLGRTTLSAGVRQEYDELLGVEGNGVTARGSLRFRLGNRTALAGVYDRAVSSGLGTPAPGRAQLAFYQDADFRTGHIQICAGARMGRLRESEFSETVVALGTILSIRDVVSVNATAGSGQLSEGPWMWHAAFGVGIELASIGAHFRYIFRPEGRGTTRAVAFTYSHYESTLSDSSHVSTRRH